MQLKGITGDMRAQKGKISDLDAAFFTCDDMQQDNSVHGGIHECRYSQSLCVNELLRDIEGSGSPINLCDMEGEQREMNEHS